MTSSTAMRLRAVLRRAGLVRLAMMVLRAIGYEQLFTRAMTRVISRGDCVWNVGANVGHYSRIFPERVGPNSVVSAFEPLPETVDRLRENVADLEGVRIMPFALSASSGAA
ncbi:FkbM family methyltransferase [Roseomonas sp. GCM10028921]